jgi:excisionase family DNA binding protein
MSGRELEAVGQADRLLTVAQVAATLQVDDDTVRRWLRAGQLLGTNLGSRAGYRVRQSDLDAFLDARSNRKSVG